MIRVWAFWIYGERIICHMAIKSYQQRKSHLPLLLYYLVLLPSIVLRFFDSKFASANLVFERNDRENHGIDGHEISLLNWVFRNRIYGTFNACHCWHVRVPIDCHLKKQMIKRKIHFDIEIYNAKMFPFIAIESKMYFFFLFQLHEWTWNSIDCQYSAYDNRLCFRLC